LPALGDDPYRLKPGATGKVCLECHLTIQETMELPYVHTPVKAGECADCHNPHASAHGQMLATDASEICSSCHDDLVPEEPRSIHAEIVQGNCVTCHDPHASQHRSGLAAEGNQLCLGCHETVAAKLADARFRHPPAADDCLTCHDPHASTEADFLLRQETSALCGDCHETASASFVERHMGYPVAESRCTSCHDPHGGETSALFLANVHAPLTRKMCNQCHLDPASPDALSTKQSGMELCRGCHSREVNEIQARNRIHWPVADEAGCLHCHNPHASNEDALLPAPTKVLCASCHENTMKGMEASLVRHSPSDQGDCAVCHAPHASDNLFLMQEPDVIQLCSTCHDWATHSSHPIGAEHADLRNMNVKMDCLSCHEAHGSPFKAMAPKDPGGDLCVECHQLISR
jgi:predicted CXXCH cytochrome family protein